MKIEAADPLGGGFDGGDFGGGNLDGGADDFGGGQVGAGLVVEMTDLTDEVPVDGDIVYEVRIRNASNQSDSNVVLTVQVPQGLEPLPADPGERASYRVDGQQILFGAIQEIRGGETLPPFRFGLRAKQPGEYRVEAFVKSTRDTTAVTAQEETSVFGN